MKIGKDAEWNRLEGRVDQLRGKLKEAMDELDAHARKSIAGQSGVVVGETVVECGGSKFLITDVEPSYYSPYLYGRKFRKDGQPADKVQCLYNHNWTIVK